MSNRKSTTKTTREDRAATLLAEGKIRLNLDGTATAYGSGSAVYIIDKTGCTCPDRQKRGESCKHEIAARSLCKLYRACREQAKETGRTRIPYLLAKALPKGGVTSPAPVAVPVLTCGDCGVTIPRGKTCPDCLDKALGFTLAA